MIGKPVPVGKGSRDLAINLKSIRFGTFQNARVIADLANLYLLFEDGRPAARRGS